MKRVDWRSIAPIFADVMISPWNLLVGGLLIKYLSTAETVLSIIFGYVILGILFYFYGGLGFYGRKQSADIINAVFGSNITRYLVPSVLAIGQIGWASINIELGGNSLAQIFQLPTASGLVLYLYALHLILLGALDLYKMGIVKFFITISSTLLLLYVFVSKVSQVTFSDFILYKPLSSQSLLWGVSVVVASLISFSTVTPDFFQSVKSKKDVFLSTVFGLFFPGVATALLGSYLFFDRGNFNLIALISGLTFAVFPHILNVVTNTDGSVAIYTPGLKLQNMFGINLKVGIVLAGAISFILALFQISYYLESWLKILSLLFPALIGIVFARRYISRQEAKLFQQAALPMYGFSTVISVALMKYFPPVLISLVLPLLLFRSYSFIRKTAK